MGDVIQFRTSKEMLRRRENSRKREQHSTSEYNTDLQNRLASLQSSIDRIQQLIHRLKMEGLNEDKT